MKRLLPYLLLLIIVIVFFWQFTFTGKIPIDSTALYQMRPWSKWAGNPYDPSAYDTARYYHNIDPVVEVLPIKTWMASYLLRGDVPLWIPSLFSGSPFAANHHAAPWDVSTFFFLLLPSKIAFGITLLFQLFIAGASTFFCSRVFGLSIRPSLIAAAGYMFNNFFFHWLGLISFNAGLIWLPLVPAGIELALRHQMKLGWVIAAIALAFTFLSGMAQFWLFNLFVFITYAIYRFWTIQPRPSSAISGFVLALILGCAGGAVQIDQVANALSHTSRGGLSPASPYEGRNHLSPRKLPTLLIPDLYGHHLENAYSKLFLKPPDPQAKTVVSRLIWGEKGSVLNRTWGYVGYVTFFLMIAALFKAPRPISYFRWLAIGVIAFQVLLCWPAFHDFCTRIWSGFDTLDHTRTIVLYSFSACILAAYALENLDQLKSRRRLIMRGLYLWMSILIFGFLLTHFFANSLGYTQKLIHNSEQTKWVTPEFYIDAEPQINHGIRQSANILIPPIILTGILVLLVRIWYHGRLSTQALQTLLIVVTVADLFYRGWNDPPLEFTASQRLYPEGSKVLQFLKNDHDLFRVYELHKKKNLPSLPLKRYSDLELFRKGTIRFFDFRSIDFVFRPNTLLNYGVDSAGGYLSLYPARYRDLWDGRGMDVLKAIKSGQSGDFWNVALLGMQNIKYLLLPEEVSTEIWHPVFRAEGIKVMKVDFFIPRYFAVGRARMIPNQQLMLQLIQNDQFNPAQEVLLDHQPPFQDSESFQGSVRIISKTPDVVNLQADFSSNGYLVIAENNFPGWHAEIDGKSAPILTANYAFQALALKQGKHAIKMEFRPAYYTISLFITITSFLIMITALIIQRRTVKVS